MMLRKRRLAAMVSVVALATGATAALAGSAGASATPRAAATVAPTVGINGLCGGVVAAPIPTNLRAGGSESNTLRVFRERLAFKTSGSIPVDFTKVGLYDQVTDIPTIKPTIPSGTLVNSYILHSDPPGTPADRLHRAATIGFTSDVLGVEVLSPTLSESQTLQLRNPFALYAGNASGLELAIHNDHVGDVARLVNARTVSVSFKTSNQVDEIRVITKATTATTTALKGYRMLAADGGVFDFGGQQFYGSTGGRVLNKPVVAGVNTCGNAGYWFVASDGGVFSYGDATYYGSLGDRVLTSPVVGMAASPTGAGYYLVQANGTVSHFGDAGDFGDASHIQLNKPIVGMAVTPSGLGYWLVASDGGIFSFGDAKLHFYGSTGNLHLVSPIIGMFSALDGRGYYLYAADGGMFTFQQSKPSQVHEPFFGSAGGAVRSNPIVGARLAADGQGYWFDDSAGILHNFGPSAPSSGDMTGVTLFRPMIGMM
jgi:hypothetical protein